MSEISVTGGGVPSLTNTLTDTHIFVGDSNNEPADVALTLSATGGTFALANTGVLTMPNADAVTRGLLTAADWTTFNNKQNAIADWTTAFNSGTQATSSWSATNAAANVNAAIVPKGTGALIVQIPDGTVTGGNARGTYAVDLQRIRTNAAQVASGAYSFVGGRQSQASGAYSFAFGYPSNATNDFAIALGQSTASGSGAIAIGTCTATGELAVAMGRGCTAGGNRGNTAIGNNNTAGGDGATALGAFTTASKGALAVGESLTAGAQYSFARGLQSSASLEGQGAFARGRFSANGDAQGHELIWRRLVTGAPVGGTELFLDGASIAAILPSTNAIWQGIIDIAAICTATGNGTTVTGDVEATSYKVTIKRIGTATSLVGTVQEIGTTNADTSMASGVFTIDNNDTNESLRIVYTSPVTAGTTTTIRAVATFRGLQIQY